MGAKMILDIIKNINIEISEQINNEELYLKYTSDSYCECITFLGIRIWDSENSICYFDDELNTIESIEHAVRRRVNKIIRKMKEISV